MVASRSAGNQAATSGPASWRSQSQAIGSFCSRLCWRAWIFGARSASLRPLEASSARAASQRGPGRLVRAGTGRPCEQRDTDEEDGQEGSFLCSGGRPGRSGLRVCPKSPKGAKVPSPGRQPWEPRRPSPWSRRIFGRPCGASEEDRFLSPRFPGLTPWAIHFRPFGAETEITGQPLLGQTLNTFRSGRDGRRDTEKARQSPFSFTLEHHERPAHGWGSTFHSRMPPEKPSWSCTSTRSAVVRTGAKRTRLSRSRAVPYPEASATGFQVSPSL